MNVITVSREPYAGGGELARGLASQLGWDLLDRELVHQAAAIEQFPDAELEQLDEHAFTLAERLIFDPPYERYLHGLREATRQAAARGRVILVGRGMRHLLDCSADHLHVRLVAPFEWRAQRCSEITGAPLPEARSNCARRDKRRERFVHYFFGKDANSPSQFDVIFNTARVPIADAVQAVTGLVQREWPMSATTPTAKRLLTLTFPVGTLERDADAALAQRLGLRLANRTVLEHVARQLGLTLSQAEQIDEQPGWIFQRMFASNIHNRYFKALEQKVREEADAGDALPVNRGAAFLLRDRPAACHVQLTANHEQRLLGVMRDHWLREDVAEKYISHSDSQRRRFHEVHFHADWTNSLEYHLTINTGRLGASVHDLIEFVASKVSWQ